MASLTIPGIAVVILKNWSQIEPEQIGIFEPIELIVMLLQSPPRMNGKPVVSLHPHLLSILGHNFK